MITVEDCVSQVEKADSKIKVVSIKDYGSDFLLTCSYDGKDNTMDPFILVDKKTGETNAYTIAEDPDKYYSAKELL